MAVDMWITFPLYQHIPPFKKNFSTRYTIFCVLTMWIFCGYPHKLLWTRCEYTVD